MAYANQTEVSVEKSRAELESILNRYGADNFGYMAMENRAVVGFTCKGKSIRFTLPLPARKDEQFWKTSHTNPNRRKQRNEQDAYKAWEQACRSRWRALNLCVKAKLEAVESGITSFEAEFLAHFVIKNGQTFGEYAIPEIEAAYRNKQMPNVLMLSDRP